MQVALVYLERFRRNSVLKCVLQPKITRNSLKTPILGVQGHSRSSMLVPLESSSAVLAMICSKSASICNRFHARWANSGKITISKGVIPLWCPHPQHQITSLETRHSRLSYCEDPESISPGLGIPPGRDRETDGRTDRIAIANTRLSSTCRYSCGA